ncbi:hypothetical protein HZP25_15900 [Elizabethkingia anophelis]|nr:hypothetical protein [Elizabethkingia anophelis]
MRIRSNIQGLDEVLRKLRRFGSEGERKIADITKATALDIQSEATRNAPTVYRYVYGNGQNVNGEIAQSIFATAEGKLSWSVSVNSVMGAYAEFGTGAYVQVADEWKDIAWTYYVNGRGLMMPQPYFYPAWVHGKTQYMIDLREAIRQLERRI